jgi:cobalt/nickel transport system permease protein
MGAGHAHALYVHEHTVLHRLAPEVKVGAAFLFVLGVALTPRRAVWAFAVDLGVLAMVAHAARLRTRFILARATVILPFLLLALMVPFVASGPRVQVLGLSVSEEGLWGAWNIFAKASLGVTTSIILAGTTEIAEILRGLSRLKVPAAFTAIAGFMVRYLEVIAGELRRMRVAMTARGYDPRWLWQAKPIATSAGALFIRSYERGERVHSAMAARGYDGVMPDLGHRRADMGDWLKAALVPAVAMAGALVGVLMLT